MQCDFNVTVGYLDENMSEDFPHMIMAGMTKADGMMRIFWDDAISDLVSGRPVDLSGEAYIPESEEAGGGDDAPEEVEETPPKRKTTKRRLEEGGASSSSSSLAAAKPATSPSAAAPAAEPVPKPLHF